MNKIKCLVTLLFCFSLGLPQSKAQIDAPDLTCIAGDSLFFQQVNPSCGPVTGIVIYISQALDGPYRVLDSLNDLTATNYVHDTTGTFFYFLQTVADCPGEIALNSDTLSNQSVQPIEILSASVEGNGIRLVWSESNNPNVRDYIIFRSTPSGSISIDTIPDTTYLDLGADIALIQNYLVLTRDVCGETSIFPEAHNSIIIDTILSPCLDAQAFRVNPYRAWVDDGYTISVYADNLNDQAPPIPIDSFNNNEDILIAGLMNGVPYCTYVVLENRVNGRTVRSSDICFIPNYNQPVERVEIKSLGFLPGQSTDLSVEWIWNSNASIENAAIFTERDSFPIPLSFPLNNNNNQLIEALPGARVHIWTIDSCDNTFSSSTHAAPDIDLTIDRSNQLKVDHLGPALPAEMIFVSARLLLIDNLGNLATIDNNLQANGTVILDGNIFDDDELCLTVEYLFRDSAANRNYTSFGPTACAQKFPVLYFPSAFSPNGVNFEFKARTTRRTINGYLLQVYDRYGQKLFETKDILEGWSGLNENGRPLASGIYLYRVQIQNDAYDWKSQGTVFLLK